MNRIGGLILMSAKESWEAAGKEPVPLTPPLALLAGWLAGTGSQVQADGRQQAARRGCLSVPDPDTHPPPTQPWQGAVKGEGRGPRTGSGAGRWKGIATARLKTSPPLPPPPSHRQQMALQGGNVLCSWGRPGEETALQVGTRQRQLAPAP